MDHPLLVLPAVLVADFRVKVDEQEVRVRLKVDRRPVVVRTYILTSFMLVASARRRGSIKSQQEGEDRRGAKR